MGSKVPPITPPRGRRAGSVMGRPWESAVVPTAAEGHQRGQQQEQEEQRAATDEPRVHGGLAVLLRGLEYGECGLADLHSGMLSDSVDREIHAQDRKSVV